ncbi:MAG: M15 family metallopeptidase [Acidimicrobiales bacterium]
MGHALPAGTTGPHRRPRRYPARAGPLVVPLGLVLATWTGAGAQAAPSAGSVAAGDGPGHGPVPGLTAAPPFAFSVSPVTASSVPYTWRPGCPVGPARLRMLHLSYWGFDAKAHTGRMVVNEIVVSDVVKVFRLLYDERFPIWEMVPEDAYHGNDNRAAAADDTSGFNCRLAVASGPPQWSVHAYGEAIDVNDVQNPYVFGTEVIPPAGTAYLDRADVRPGMAVRGGELVQAFASVGWYWGGRWTASPDYQHFSLTGG